MQEVLGALEAEVVLELHLVYWEASVVLEYQALPYKDILEVAAHNFLVNIRWAVAVAVLEV
jgi:hypothetical protein